MNYKITNLIILMLILSGCASSSSHNNSIAASKYLEYNPLNIKSVLEYGNVEFNKTKIYEVETIESDNDNDASMSKYINVLYDGDNTKSMEVEFEPYAGIDFFTQNIKDKYKNEAKWIKMHHEVAKISHDQTLIKRLYYPNKEHEYYRLIFGLAEAKECGVIVSSLIRKIDKTTDEIELFKLLATDKIEFLENIPSANCNP